MATLPRFPVGRIYVLSVAVDCLGGFHYAVVLDNLRRVLQRQFELVLRHNAIEESVICD